MIDYLYQIVTDKRKGVFEFIVKSLMRGLSIFYYLIISIINFGYGKKILSSYSLGKPVISIGNITWGGVGKTPFVALLSRYLKELGYKPVILTRGYKGKTKNGRVSSDESLLMAELTSGIPILVAQNRYKAAQRYMQENDVDVFLLDDGYQHRRLARDLDVLLLDTTNPFGNGALIPRGILREPINALQRADVIILTKIDIGQRQLDSLKDTLKRLDLTACIAESVHRPLCFFDIEQGMRMELTSMRGAKVCLLSAIGDPQSFETMVMSLGLEVQKHFLFRDHHWYSRKELIAIASFCAKGQIKNIITTRKDSVKLEAFNQQWSNGIRILVLDIAIEVKKGKQEFYDRIHHILQR